MRRIIPRLFLLLLFAIALRAQGPATVTISDTLYSQSGGLATGTLTVTNAVTFVSSDGFQIFQGQTITSPIGANGQFSLQLVPNIGGAPYNSFYYADYQTNSAYVREIWVVPQSASAINLQAVRVIWPTAPNVLIPAAQFVPPPSCTPVAAASTNLVLRYTTNPTGWICAPDNMGTVTLNLENPTPADAGKFEWKPKNALNLTRISCSVDAGTVSVNLDVRTEAAPNNPGNTVLSTPLVCQPVTVATTSFATAVVPSDAPVALIVTNVTGTPGVVRIHAEYILN